MERCESLSQLVKREWFISFVIYGHQGAEEDAEKLQLTDKLVQAVLAEARVVCTGQPAVIPCLAKGIFVGKFVYLACYLQVQTGGLRWFS